MSAQGRRVAAIVLALFLLLVAALVLWPSHPDTAGLYAHADRLLAPLARDGLPAIVLHDGALEFAGNVAMFFPLGVLGTLCLPRRWWWLAALGCIVLSCGIEAAQLLFLHGRTFSPRDIVGNSAGGLVGVGVGVAVHSVAGAIARRRAVER